MVKLLDERTSQNASYGNSIGIALVADTPTSIGVVGLNVTGASGVLRVSLNGIAVIDLPDEPPPPENNVIALGVIRGTEFIESALVGYVGYPLEPTDTGVKILNLTISDYNVPYPASNELVYTLVLFSAVGGTRIGPESFNAAAYSD